MDKIDLGKTLHLVVYEKDYNHMLWAVDEVKKCKRMKLYIFSSGWGEYKYTVVADNEIKAKELVEKYAKDQNYKSDFPKNYSVSEYDFEVVVSQYIN